MPRAPSSSLTHAATLAFTFAPGYNCPADLSTDEVRVQPQRMNISAE